MWLTASSQKHSGKAELSAHSAILNLHYSLYFLGSAHTREFIPTSNTTQHSVLNQKPNTGHKSCSSQQLSSTGICWHCWTEVLLCRGLLQWHQNKILQYLCQAAQWHIKSQFHPSTHLSPPSLHISSHKVPGHPMLWPVADCIKSKTSCRTQWAAAPKRKLHPKDREDLEENRPSTWAMSDLE